MSNEVFVYGSLLFADVFEAVSGASAPRTEARLAGFARYRLRGETYPAIVPEPGAETLGAVYRSVTHAMLDRLDRFEGEEYLRTAVDVLLSSGERLTAHAYVLDPLEHRRLEPEPWDPEHFDRTHRAAFAALHPLRR